MITPVELKNYQLKTSSMSGNYVKKDVDDYIDLVNRNYEDLYKEDTDLKDQISKLNEGINYYKNMEGTLQKALVLAEKTRDDTLKEAQAEADKVISDAKTQGEQIVNDARAEADKLAVDRDAILNEAKESADKTIADAQNEAAEKKAAAEEEADRTVEDAKAEADRLTAEAKDNAEKAENALKEAQDKADAEAEKIIADAQKKADKLAQDKEHELKEITDKIHALKGFYEEYQKKAREIVKSTLDDLNTEKYTVSINGLDDALADADKIVADNADASVGNIDTIGGVLEASNVQVTTESLDNDARDELNASGLNFDIGSDSTYFGEPSDVTVKSEKIESVNAYQPDIPTGNANDGFTFPGMKVSSGSSKAPATPVKVSEAEIDSAADTVSDDDIAAAANAALDSLKAADEAEKNNENSASTPFKFISAD
jgi:cell division initiation protein